MGFPRQDWVSPSRLCPLLGCSHPQARLPGWRQVSLTLRSPGSQFQDVTPIHNLDIPQVSQVEPVRREGELWHIRAQAGLSVAAIIAVDIFFHFFYILTIPSDLKFASRLPDSALGGCMGDPEQGWGLGCPPPPER